MRYSIIYSSKTGNTKKLALAIKDYLSPQELDYFGEPTSDIKSDYIYLGFWTDKGTADALTLEFIKTLKNKKIFLFGTAGFGVSEDYFKTIIERVKNTLDSTNEVIGEFMCMGRMPLSVKERYIKLKESKANIPNLDLLINNFDKALSHPDSEDIKGLLERI